MIVYQTNYEGYYVGEVEADESPLEPGVFLVPGGAVETPPPVPGSNERARFINGSWILEQIPEPDPEPEPTPEERRQAILDGITQERNRRMRETFEFQGNLFDVDSGSLQRITGAGALAGFAISIRGVQPGDLFWHGAATPFTWITATNTLVQMDAYTVLAFSEKAAENESRYIFAARALKDMDPLPEDYTNDIYWPPRPTLE